MFWLFLICAVLLFSLNFVALLIFMQLKNVQRTLNQQAMNTSITDFFKSRSGNFGGYM